MGQLADSGRYFINPPWFLASSEPLIIATDGRGGLSALSLGREPQPSSQTHFSSYTSSLRLLCPRSHNPSSGGDSPSLQSPCGLASHFTFPNPAFSFSAGCPDFTPPFFFFVLKEGNLWQKSKALEHRDGLRPVPG